MEIKKSFLSDNQYVKGVPTVKKQIVLHHTVSGAGVEGDISWWEKTIERIATHFIISREGEIYQLFPLENWAYHLGVKQDMFQKLKLPYMNLDPHTVGIELDSWGPVMVHTDGQYYPVKWSNGKFLPDPAKKPVKYFYEYCPATPYRGHRLYEAYTMQQIEALAFLLPFIAEQTGITLSYNSDIWQVCPRALKGEMGIFSHTSYRQDKSDVHPQSELTKLLETWKK